MNWMDAWLFPLGSVLLGGVGMLCLVRGLFGGRFVARTARGCRRCGYDMTSTRGHRCPECGFEHAYESEHYAGRRRWSVAGLGALLLLLSVGLGLGPAVRALGWKGVLPDAVQASYWDGTDPVLHERLRERFWSGALSSRAADELRARVRDVLCDPQSMPAQLDRGVEFLDPPVAVELFGEPGRLDLIERGRAVAAAAAIRRSIRLGAPEGDAMRAWRHAQLDGKDFSRRTVVFTWMLCAPTDDADRLLVRYRFAAGGVAANWRLTDDFEGLEPLFHAVLLDLLNDEDERVRFHALESAQFMGRRLAIVPGPLVDRLKEIARDTEHRGWDAALRILSDVPFDAGPWLADWLGAEGDPEVLFAVVTLAERRRDASAEVIGALAAIANDRSRPIGLRLDAAAAHGRVSRMPGAMVGAPQDDVTSVYEELWGAMLRGEAWVEALARESIGEYPSASAVMALARAVPDGVAGREGIEDWLGRYPALARTVGRWTPTQASASEKIRAGLRRMSWGPSASPSLASEASVYAERWFGRP